MPSRIFGRVRARIAFFQGLATTFPADPPLLASSLVSAFAGIAGRFHLLQFDAGTHQSRFNGAREAVETAFHFLPFSSLSFRDSGLFKGLRGDSSQKRKFLDSFLPLGRRTARTARTRGRLCARERGRGRKGVRRLDCGGRRHLVSRYPSVSLCSCFVRVKNFLAPSMNEPARPAFCRMSAFSALGSMELRRAPWVDIQSKACAPQGA
jgi:hypothetical protein